MTDIKFERELLIENDLREPHFSYLDDGILDRERVSSLISFKSDEEILLVDSYGFNFDSIFAGLSKSHIEHIAKNAPKDYRDNILKLLRDQEMINGVFEIAKAMDEDLGKGATQNQDRVRNVIQYIKDNRVAFEF